MHVSRLEESDASHSYVRVRVRVRVRVGSVADVTFLL